MGDWKIEGGRVTTLDLGGFNEIRFCRHGPMMYNKFDQFVGGSLRRYGEYSHGEFELFARLVGGADTVVEVGANLGAHTVPLAKRAYKVIAFEPQRLMFQTLCGNLALNQLTNVEAYQQAVGSGYRNSAQIAQYPPDEPCNFGALSIVEAPRDLKYETVPCVALDKIGLASCDFLKIDVEGMEQEVLEGGRNMIETHRPVIYCENDRKDKGEALVACLRSMNYDLYWHMPFMFNPLNHASNPRNEYPNIVSVNMLCMPAGVAPPVFMQPVARWDELYGTSLAA